MKQTPLRGVRRYPYWPTRPDRVVRDGRDTHLEFDLDRDGRVDYTQRMRSGYKDALRFVDATGSEVVIRPAADPTSRPLLVLLLDGVAYERVQRLYERGCFRLFHPPARVITVFPTLTDPAYDVLFCCGPTPGYEAGYYDRLRNRLTPAIPDYLRGRNERWVRHADYRLNFVEDGLMYLFPQGVFSSELRRARRVLARCLARGQRQIVLYLLSTDALGHMLTTAGIERHLVRLDAWIERLLYDARGQLEIVLLADHGIAALSPSRGHVRPFDLLRVLRAGGLRVASRLDRPGDVAVPLFGLLDVGRMHTFDATTRDRVVETLRPRPEIEVIAARHTGRVRVYANGSAADIACRNPAASDPDYCYLPIDGDPLDLDPTCAALSAAGRLDAEGFASARTWLEATSTHDFPAAVPRLWDGLFTHCREQPDVVISLKERWFVGSGLLSSFVRMHGTHGGLHRRASETFVMTTCVDLPSPLSLPDVRALLAERLNWPVGGRR